MDSVLAQTVLRNETKDKPANRPSTSVVEEKPAWQGAVDRQAIINGFIFAEILQPPRAYRPIIKSNRRNPSLK